MSNANRNTEQASWYRTRRGPEGSFTCDRCGSIWPLGDLVLQEGRNFCAKRCAYPESDTAQQTRLAEDLGRSYDDPYPLPKPVKRIRIAAVTDITPASVQLAPGGASTAIVLAGYKFDSTQDAVTATAGLTAVAVFDSVRQITVTLSADLGTASGDSFWLYFNSSKLHGLTIKVR